MKETWVRLERRIFRVIRLALHTSRSLITRSHIFVKLAKNGVNLQFVILEMQGFSIAIVTQLDFTRVEDIEPCVMSYSYITKQHLFRNILSSRERHIPSKLVGRLFLRGVGALAFDCLVLDEAKFLRYHTSESQGFPIGPLLGYCWKGARLLLEPITFVDGEVKGQAILPHQVNNIHVRILFELTVEALYNREMHVLIMRKKRKIFEIS